VSRECEVRGSLVCDLLGHDLDVEQRLTGVGAWVWEGQRPRAHHPLTRVDGEGDCGHGRPLRHARHTHTCAAQNGGTEHEMVREDRDAQRVGYAKERVGYVKEGRAQERRLSRARGSRVAVACATHMMLRRSARARSSRVCVARDDGVRTMAAVV
jgi:hypothetical protein